MPLPPLPTLSAEASQDDKALYLYLKHLKDGLDGFTPSQVAAALNIGALGSGPGSPLNEVTLPVATPTPATPVMAAPIGFYRQIVTSWAKTALKADIDAHAEAVNAQEGWARHSEVHPNCDICVAHDAVKTAIKVVS